MALANTFLFGYYLMKFLKRWIRHVPRPDHVPAFPAHGLLKSNQKLESIKQILSSENFEEDEDLSDSEDNQESRVDENVPATVEQEYEEELIRDLISLIKKRNKNW